MVFTAKPVVAVSLAAWFASAAAWPALVHAAPEALLNIRPKTAGLRAPLGGDGRPYAQARKALARGRPGDALKALKRSKTSLLEDREALLKADALLALGDRSGAQKAYLLALEKAQLPAVGTAAARGLVNVLGQRNSHTERLGYLDALLGRKDLWRPEELLYQKALSHKALKQYDEAAKTAFKLLQNHPTSRSADAAEALLAALKKRGAKVPAITSSSELRRISKLIRGRAFAQAERAMEALQKRSPKLATSIQLKRAELYQKRRKRAEEEALLLKLKDKKLGKRSLAKIYSRLGRLAMARDDDPGAIANFDRLKAVAPKTLEAINGEYLAGWIPYNAGNYAEATKRMLAFADAHKKTKKRDEALWYAGWAAYLGKKDGLSRRALEQLIEEHPNSSLVPHAHYWLGRIRQRGSNLAQAKVEYREVLKSAPLSYYGFWASTRLEQLGEKIVLDAPPPKPAPASLRTTVRRLGLERPILIDRAIVLYRAGLGNLAQQELTAAARYFRSIRDGKGRTMVADMLKQLGAHNLAFRIALTITQDGSDLITGEPYAWRAWRHAYPLAFEKEVQSASKTHEVDEHLILSIMRTESHFRPWVRSRVGARGLMQLMPKTARRIGRKVKKGRYHAARYKNPASNVWLGTWYLSSLLERYESQLPAAAGAYNAGPRAMDGWLRAFGTLPLDEFVERIPYRETRRYVRRVLETYMVYRRLNGKPMPNLLAKLKAQPNAASTVNF